MRSRLTDKIDDAIGVGCALVTIASITAAIVLPIWVIAHFIMKYW